MQSTEYLIYCRNYTYVKSDIRDCRQCKFTTITTYLLRRVIGPVWSHYHHQYLLQGKPITAMDLIVDYAVI